MTPVLVMPMLLLLLAGPAQAAGASDLACSLNGVLVGGKCKCDVP